MNLFHSFKDKSDDKSLRLFIENVFGFSPKNIHVYKLAFLHHSVATEINEGRTISNERLEYLGDAILSAIIADYLYKKFPFKDEGFLTQMRSKIVSRNRLNKLAQHLGFNDFIQASNKVGYMNKDVMGNAFEAFVGALYIDKGFKFTKKTIIKKVLGYYLDIDEIESENNNFKSQLIALAQAEKKTVTFKVVEKDDTNNKNLYTVALYINDVQVALGEDFAIKKAEQNAAENFLKTIHNS